MVIPEPFTITATSLGIAATLLSLVIDSAHTLFKAKKEYQKCDSDIKHLRQVVETCDGELNAWWERWTNDDAQIISYDELRYLLGREGFDGVFQRVTDVVKAKASLHQLLVTQFQPLEDGSTSCGPKKGNRTVKINEKELQALNRASNFGTDGSLGQAFGTTKAPGTSRNTSHVKVKVSSKLLWALVTGDELRKSVVFLQDTLSDLHTYTDLRLAQLDISRQADTSEVKQRLKIILASRLYVQRFDEGLSELLLALSRHTSATPEFSCSLLLRFPDTEGSVECIRNDDILTVTILAEGLASSPEMEAHRRIVNITFPYDEEDTKGKLAALALDGELNFGQITVPPVSLTGRHTCLRLALGRSRSPVHDTLQHDTLQHDILVIAIAYINWSLLLWHSSWTAQLCCCNLTQCDADSARYLNMYLKHTSEHLDQVCNTAQLENEVDAYLHGEQVRNKWIQKFPRGSPRRKKLVSNKCRLIILGTTLCELALWKSLKVFMKDSGDLDFHLQDGSQINEKRMLTMVVRQCAPLKRAVKLCFELAKNPSHHLWYPDTVIKFSEDILEGPKGLIGAYDSIFRPDFERSANQRRR